MHPLATRGNSQKACKFSYCVCDKNSRDVPAGPHLEVEETVPVVVIGMDAKIYSDIWKYLEDGSYPSDFVDMDDKAKAKNMKRAFRKKCLTLVLKDGLLYHVPMKSKPSMLKEVTKIDDKNRVLRAFHGVKAGGCHFGVTAPLQKL